MRAWAWLWAWTIDGSMALALGWGIGAHNAHLIAPALGLLVGRAGAAGFHRWHDRRMALELQRMHDQQ